MSLVALTQIPGPPLRAECGENGGGEQKLQACRKPTRAVPAVVVEQFPSARAHEWKNVLEVRRGARRRAKCRWIERTSPRAEEEDARQTAADLESTRVEVSVRKAVPRDMENRPQKECCESRAAGGARRGACRHVEGNDHGCLARPNASVNAAREVSSGMLPRSVGDVEDRFSDMRRPGSFKELISVTETVRCRR